jgi:hypothetical protein
MGVTNAMDMFSDAVQKQYRPGKVMATLRLFLVFIVYAIVNVRGYLLHLSFPDLSPSKKARA